MTSEDATPGRCCDCGNARSTSYENRFRCARPARFPRPGVLMDPSGANVSMPSNGTCRNFGGAA